MRIPLIVSILIACMTDTAFSIEIDGRYESTVEVLNLESGLESAMVNFLEVETLNQDSIYFVYESWHTNGHACRLYGSAKKIDLDTYEYVQENEILPKKNYCTARIYKSDTSIIVEDVDGSCRADNCGARGEIGKSSFPLNSHKNISTPVVAPW
ncbi:hypothetical protein [Pseudomonas leptonychotis]|uniref:hypothetical protein n=1 Tax=Pseudomonas leptonychotis TaxID=2448482 RepID=UPI0039EEEDD1